MKAPKQIRNMVIIGCILALVLSGLSSEIHETVQGFRAFQSSYSEIKEPCSCMGRPVLFAEEELADSISNVLENVLCREMNMSGEPGQFLACLFAYLAFLAVLLKHFASGIYHFSCSPTRGLARILTFIQDADGRKRIS